MEVVFFYLLRSLAMSDNLAGFSLSKREATLRCSEFLGCSESGVSEVDSELESELQHSTTDLVTSITTR